MTARPSLNVLMPEAPGQRWSCRSCGRCCYDLVGHLTEAERARIDRQAWAETLGVEPTVRLGRGHVLNKHDNGACVFLDQGTNRCRIHEKFGARAKPLACRIYPFTVRDVPQGWRVSWRFDCPSVSASDGEPMDAYRDLVTDVTGTLDHHGATGDDCPEIGGGLRASENETRKIVDRLVRWLGDRDRPLTVRLAGAASVTALLSEARYTHVREARMLELIDVLFGAAGHEDRSNGQDAAPSSGQMGLMRELAFVHAEHATLEEMNAGAPARWVRRLGQLRTARRFRAGRGAVPTLRGLPDGARFADVERVEPARGSDDARAVDDLVVRYVTHRLRTRSAFGYGYYRWPIFTGLQALWAAMAVLGWLARVHAAAMTARARPHDPASPTGAATEPVPTPGARPPPSSPRDRDAANALSRPIEEHGEPGIALSFTDVAEALRVVDRSAGRSPALGTRGERLRLKYLAVGDGLVKLLRRYPLVRDQP